MSFRKIWQAAMIALARSRSITRLMQSWSSSSRLAKRYVAGASAAAACETAIRMRARSIRASLFYMGEYLDDEAHVDLNTNHKIEIAQTLAEAALDVHVSVDPTQIGFSIDAKLGTKNAFKIARTISTVSAGIDGVHCLMLDMEDLSMVEPTLRLHDQLMSAGLPVGQTLQAHLRRTEGDIALKIDQGGKVRLVKGAFVEANEVSFRRHSETKSNYLSLAKQMLAPAARSKGFYPIFATHDDTFHCRIIAYAQKNGWQKQEYEFEMLYGARPDIAAKLAESGYRIREYVAYGSEWWPYAARRIGENPRGGLQLLRAILPWR